MTLQVSEAFFTKIQPISTPPCFGDAPLKIRPAWTKRLLITRPVVTGWNHKLIWVYWLWVVKAVVSGADLIPCWMHGWVSWWQLHLHNLKHTFQTLTCHRNFWTNSSSIRMSGTAPQLTRLRHLMMRIFMVKRMTQIGDSHGTMLRRRWVVETQFQTWRFSSSNDWAPYFWQNCDGNTRLALKIQWFCGLHQQF